MAIKTKLYPSLINKLLPKSIRYRVILALLEVIKLKVSILSIKGISFKL